ncbi:hypothetical protein Thiowin_02808 [Thiorhodovibrio winogradskyi]|uniref:Uncharacterized protein n=1 Tax=Thiorhodovibrio winogradskyi TaxID=77007 RepID=A0ABZ0SBD8_9GAMM
MNASALQGQCLCSPLWLLQCLLQCSASAWFGEDPEGALCCAALTFFSLLLA